MKELFASYLKQYSDTLNKEVVPFWLKYAIDETGAINNCLNEDGTLILVYGIEVYENDATLPMLVLKDVFTRQSQAEELAELCTRLELDPVHLTDVVEDLLISF